MNETNETNDHVAAILAGWDREQQNGGILVPASHEPGSEHCPQPTEEGRAQLLRTVDRLEASWPEPATFCDATDDAIDLLEELRERDSSDCPSCQQCAEFSWEHCEVCGALAGERHALALIWPGTHREPIYYSACSDCLIFAANGDLPE